MNSEVIIMKRLIALTLIVVLALTVLAGCASKPADNTGNVFTNSKLKALQPVIMSDTFE